MTNGLLINALGVCAAGFSMSSFIPQAIKIIHEHDASSVSLRMYVITVIGFGLWIAYGFLLKSWPLLASNVVNLSLSSFILTLKFRYRDGATAKSSGSPHDGP